MVSVVMVSYLGDYSGARSNPDQKFIRAVQSFLDQKLEGSELIIVADGCEKTMQLASKFENPTIRAFMRPKAKGWPGTHRQFGIQMAENQIITYLDSDDVLLPGRLLSILENLGTKSFVLDSLMVVGACYPRNHIKNNSHVDTGIYDEKPYYVYKNKHQWGTFCIVHNKDVPVIWPQRQNRGEDAQFVRALLSWGKKQNYFNEADHIKPIGKYLICHVPSGPLMCDF